MLHRPSPTAPSSPRPGSRRSVRRSLRDGEPAADRGGLRLLPRVHAGPHRRRGRGARAGLRAAGARRRHLRARSWPTRTLRARHRRAPRPAGAAPRRAAARHPSQARQPAASAPGAGPARPDRPLRQAPDAPVMADTHRHDIAGWLFTSRQHRQAQGRRALPRGLRLQHRALRASSVLGIRESDVTAGVPKLFFGYATGTNLMFPFAVGGSTALFSERSTPETVFDVVERYRPTILTSVPTMIGKMLAHRGRARARATSSSLRLVLSAGETLPEALQRQWLERCGVEILDGIGSAELFHIYISNRPGAVRVGRLGQAVPGYDCRVVDPAGQPSCRAAQVGRLHVRGESSALCYWQAHEKSKETFAGDLVVTGDIFRQRRARATSGTRAAPTTCSRWAASSSRRTRSRTACSSTRPWPSAASSAGSDEEGLVKPKAFVVARAGRRAGRRAAATALTRELQEWVKQRLARAQVPALGRVPRGAAARTTAARWIARRSRRDRATLRRRAAASRHPAPMPAARTTSPSWPARRGRAARAPRRLRGHPARRLDRGARPAPAAGHRRDHRAGHGPPRRRRRCSARGRACVVLPPLAYSVTRLRGALRGHALAARRDGHARCCATCSRRRPRAGFRPVAVANAHLEPAHIETIRARRVEAVPRPAAAPPIVFPDVTRRRLAAAADRGVPQRRLPRRPVRGLARDGRRPGRREGRACAARCRAVPISLVEAIARRASGLRAGGRPQAYFGRPARPPPRRAERPSTCWRTCSSRR